VEIIAKRNYSDWKEFLQEVVEFETDELNNKLNNPALYFELKLKIQSINIEDVNSLLLSKLPLAKEIQLKQYLLEKRSDLYLRFVNDQLENAFSRANNFSDKTNAYSKIYAEHFEKNINLRKELLSQFADYFEDKLTADERSAANVYVLTNSNCMDILPPDWIVKRIQDADYWFENENILFEDKLQAAYKLSSDYDLKNIENLIPNIMKAKLSDELIKYAQKGNLKKTVEKYATNIKGLKDSEKQALFILVFNNENIKQRFDYNDFSIYINMISKNLENEPDFWYSFFRKNKNANPNNDYKKHSLDYLLKKFIVYNFKKDFRSELFEKLLPLDEYSMKWIEEEIRETTADKILLDEFYAYFKNGDNNKKTILGSITGLFRKQTEFDNSYSYIDTKSPRQSLQELNLEEQTQVALMRHLERIQNAKRSGAGIRDLPLNALLSNIPKQAKASTGLWISDIYKLESFVTKGIFYKVTRDDLVPSHNGEIANLIKPIFETSKGNILYIDNAENLFNNPNDALGRESFKYILEQIAKNENEFYIVFSDLSNEMKKLLDAYPQVKAKISVF